MQAPLAIVGLLLGLGAWWQTGHMGWVLGALLMVANWPVTFFAIMPTNNRLMAADPAAANPELGPAHFERVARWTANRSAREPSKSSKSTFKRRGWWCTDSLLCL
jgi:hypothetical protein